MSQLIEKIKADNQVKSKKRVADHGEVFTNQREVNAMLDLVKHETERIDSRFLEPACGNGNFLAEVLRRKLNVVDQRYCKSQIEWERYAVIAVSSIYGVDILEDNAHECRERLFKIFNERYTTLFKNKCNVECRRSIQFLFGRNILWGNALDFKNPVTKHPIVFSEWSPMLGGKIKRRDFLFEELVPKETKGLFDDTLYSPETGQPVFIPKPVKDYPIAYFLKIADYD